MSSNLSSVPHKLIGVGVIRNNLGKILIDRRLPKGEMAGFWEFPGGKIEGAETVEECIRREIQEELAIAVNVGDRIMEIEHDYSKFKVTLFVHDCQHLAGEPQAIECQETRWVNIEELDQFNFPEANYQIIELLKTR
ncbi:mutator mutT protein [Xenococcus sp. PCC 7305]|uniref:8-oxo-dGTP diphosphatase MutT n=1 Tax=Xenococcus sp. PCC 7305 TaxID=102125 RepID=UPI0002AC1668|nr:8-oxo-dGTP diphosphatase MutT [Xenococcus sp. PCC 7305]ELS01987.1 mutator mutT protein [Xenococcus sp. PCC 7305]